MIEYYDGIYYIVTLDNIHLRDSYRVRNTERMKTLLNFIKLRYYSDQYFFHHLPLDVLIDEWKAHSLLYDLHLFRSHTKDADLNKNNKLIQFGYYVLARIYDIKEGFK